MTNFIRIEHDAQGNLNGFSDLSLDRINRIKVGRVDGVVKTVMLFPEGEPNSAELLEGTAAQVFVAAWDKHHSIERLNEPSKTGLIQIQGAGDIIKK